jgi:hypothetical protein
MTDFPVDPAGLSGLAAQLGRIDAALAGTDHMVSAGADELGSGTVSDALDDFSSGWSHGRDEIDKNIKAVKSYLHGAAHTYREHDSKLAQSYRKAGGSGR